MAVTLIATGGTIASTRDAGGGVTASLTGADLVDALDPADLSACGGPTEIDVVDAPVPGSWNMSTARAAEVVGLAAEAIASGAEGVVITHGTDVLEETAWLAELLVSPRHDAPVLMCAAMRHASEFAGDGPRNLFDALRVAADPSSRGRGVMVCANGELHHSRWVTKTHATAVNTFESPGRGPVGEVGEQAVRFLAPSPDAPPALDGRLDSTVPVVGSHWGADPDLIDWYVDRGADGFVVEASGAGNVNSALVEGLGRALEAGRPVVVASRCRRGEATPIYGGAGGFATLHAAGAVSSRGLTAGKARLALQLALGVAGAMSEPVGPADLFERLATPGWVGVSQR